MKSLNRNHVSKSRRIKFTLLRTLYQVGIHHETALWCLGSVLVLLLSVALAWNFPENAWFARSGSIVVVLGVVSSYRGLTRSLERTFWKIEAEIQNMKNDLNLINREKDDEDYSELEGYMNSLDSFADYIHNNKRDIIGISRYIELSIVMIGTIIWGYGDILIN